LTKEVQRRAMDKKKETLDKYMKPDNLGVQRLETLCLQAIHFEITAFKGKLVQY
jgi:hypothetical protein